MAEARGLALGGVEDLLGITFGDVHGIGGQGRKGLAFEDCFKAYSVLCIATASSSI